MNISDLLAIAQEYYIATFLIVACIGIFQGAMLARGIRNKFPSLRNHARIVSITLLIVFAINTAFSINNFATLQQVDTGGITSVTNIEDIMLLASTIFGVDGGFWSIIAISLSLLLTLFFRLAELPRIIRYFVFLISIIMLLVALVARFAGYTPTVFHITMYALYQTGITLGFYFIMRRGSRTVEEF